jgi:hypothetical protein
MCAADVGARVLATTVDHDLEMTERDEVPWLTIRRDEIERLEQLAAIVDVVSDDPLGLAVALRNTPTYRKTISAFSNPTNGCHAPP